MAKKAQNKKKTTLDDLANMVGGGFKEVGQRFKEVNERFDGVEGRMDVLEQKINTVNSNVLALQFDYKKLTARIESLELRTFGAVQE